MTLSQAIWEWASGATSHPVIFANQDGDQPATPYFTLQVINTSREGTPYYGHPDDQGIITIQQGQLLTVTVAGYGDGILGALQDIRDSLDKFTVQVALRSNGIAFVDVVSEPRDTPEVTGTTWQQRALMDVQFRTLSEITDDVGIIESVRFTGTEGTTGQTVTKTVDQQGITDGT